MSKRLRHAGKAVRRGYVRELEYQIRSFREVNEHYRQALAGAEARIQLKERQKALLWQHLKSEREQTGTLTETIKKLEYKNTRLQEEASKAHMFVDLVFMDALADEDGYSQMVH